MLVNYIQSIMLTVLEIICCKIFFESFAEKRSENNWRVPVTTFAEEIIVLF